MPRCAVSLRWPDLGGAAVCCTWRPRAALAPSPWLRLPWPALGREAAVASWAAPAAELGAAAMIGGRSPWGGRGLLRALPPALLTRGGCRGLLLRADLGGAAAAALISVGCCGREYCGDAAAAVAHYYYKYKSCIQHMPYYAYLALFARPLSKY